MALGIILSGLEFHDRLGPENYELVADALEWRGPEEMEKILKPVSLNGAIVADIGIGTGRLSKMFRDKAVSQIIGVDGSSKFLMYTAKKELADRWVISEVEKDRIDLPDDSVDLATASGLFSYLSDPTEVMREMVRIVKPGGYMAFNFHPGANPMEKTREQFSAAALNKGRGGAIYHLYHHSTVEMTGTAGIMGMETVALNVTTNGVRRAVDDRWIPLTTGLFSKTGKPFRMDPDDQLRFT